MQRLILHSTPYSFSGTWNGATLYGIPKYNLGRTEIVGYWVHFPYAIGDTQIDGACKSVWYHGYARVTALPALRRAEKPRYTLVESGTTENVKVWAQVKPIDRRDSLDCTGCVHEGTTTLGKCLSSPPCFSTTRHDKKDIIFITEVAKWG